MDYRFPLVLSLVASVIVGVCVWNIQGWRYEAKISDIEATHSKELRDAEVAARNKEQELQLSANTIREEKDNELRKIKSNHAALVNSLRNRPTRTDSEVSPNTSTCSSASGAELARGDAEFLAGYLADVERLQTEFDQCVTQYNQIKDISNKGKK